MSALTAAAADIAVKRIAKADARILTIDIERVPGTALWFDRRIDYLSPRMITTHPRTICFAARWYGQKRPIFEAEWIDRGRMVQRAWELYDEADVVITYNGVKFDNKHLLSDWVEHGLGEPRPWKDLDLLRVVRRLGRETKSLDDVTRWLGREGKSLHYDVQLALAACAGDKAAQRTLREYNCGDIELTEWLADRLRGHIPNHPIIAASGDKRCNQCGSDDLALRESRYRAVVLDYALYTCRNCKGHVRGQWVSRSAVVKGVK